MQDVFYAALCALKGRYIKFPEILPDVIHWETFEEITYLPNVVGAIDGTHIHIQAPPVSAVIYLSCYQQHDKVVQAVVDGTKRFSDVLAGYPGSMHDARVLHNSLLFRQCESNEILQAPIMNFKKLCLFWEQFYFFHFSYFILL